MTRPVNTVPPLPYPGGRDDNRSLAAFDQDLVKALQIYLGELARRANLGLSIDGTDVMTGLLRIINTGGGAGARWDGRLIHLENFAPGVYMRDLSTSAIDLYINLDSNVLRLYSTSAGDGSDLVEMWSFNLSTGIFTVPGGIQFPATQVPSSNANTLDDYAEGSWTPAVTYTTPGDLSVSYTTQIGRYVKIGKLVFLKGVITFTPTFTTASGELRITGMPFTHVSGFSDTTGSCELTDFVLDATTKWCNSNITSNSNQLRFVMSHDSPTNRTAMDTSNTPTGVGISAFFSIVFEASA